MAKRGRKPKERKGYFYEREEQAIIEYINSTDEVERNRIFDTILYPALTKMIESIARRYKLFTPDEDFTETFSDTISYLLTKIKHFKPEKGYKAYSYCGTICKNYLLYKRMQTMKEIQRTESYDDTSELYGNSLEYSTEEEPSYLLAQRLISSISNDIKETLNEPEKNSLKPDEIKVGQALILLLDNWEEVLPISGSDKLQKSVVLYFLRETTMMTTKEIRENMKKFKKAYYIIKKSMT